MKKSFWAYFLPVFALGGLLFSACQKEAATAEEITNATDQALFSVQDRGGLGRFGCFDLVFPVTVTLPDGSTATVSSYEAMREAIRTFYETHGIPTDGATRPHLNFVFPIDVITQDGETTTITDLAEMRRLRAGCAGTFGNHSWQGHGSRPMLCFDIIFPITVAFPDGSTASIADREALRNALRRWRANNPDATKRPHLTFPITVKMKADGTEITLADRNQWQRLHEDCE